MQSKDVALAKAVRTSVRKRPVADYKKEYNKAGVLLVCPRLWPPEGSNTKVSVAKVGDFRVAIGERGTAV